MPYLQKINNVLKYRASAMVSGRRYTKLFKDASKSSFMKAKKWESKTRKEIQNHGKLLSVAKWFLIHGEYTEKTIKLKTFNRKKTVKARFLDFSGNIPVEKIDSFLVKKYINLQKKERPGGAVNEDIKELRSIWNWGFQTLPFFPDKNNPFTNQPKLPAIKKPHIVPTIEDFWKIYQAADQLQDQALLLIIYYTAARPIEVYRLKINDINIENNLLCLWSRKGKNHDLQPRWNPIDKNLKKILCKLLDQRKTDNKNRLLFISSAKKNKGKKIFNRQNLMKSLCEKAHVKRFGLYGIRHLRARINYTKGCSVKELQVLLGHARPSTTDYYLSQYGLDGMTGEIEDTPPEGLLDD